MTIYRLLKKSLIISFIVSITYFGTGFYFLDDPGPRWAFFVYYPIVMAAFGIGYGGGSNKQLYYILGKEFLILWAALFILILGLSFLIKTCSRS